MSKIIKYLSLPEVKEILERESTVRPLTTEQKNALLHATRFSKISATKARSMINELMKEDISEPVACKIVDIMPTHPDDLKIIFPKERFIIGQEKITKILEIVSRYRFG